MRLPLKQCADLTEPQKRLHADMKDGISKNFKGFTAIDRDGELIGPWNPWISFPEYGGPVWALVKALACAPKLAKPLREVAILATGAHFLSAYEIYAHTLVGEARGLSDAKIATIVSGQRPADLTPDEAIVYDLATALVRGPLPALPYRRAVKTFGLDATAELIYLVGLYGMVSTTLNGFDVPLPEGEDD